VPRDARSGPLAVITRANVRSPKWSGLVIERLDSAPVPPGGQPSAPSPRKVFYGGLQPAAFTYQLPGSRPDDLRVSLVRMTDSRVVHTWSPAAADPATPQRVTWDGTARGRVQPEGIYSFQLSARSATGSQVEPVGDEKPQPFAFYGHMFPVQGKHDYGGAGAHFGAGRGGRSHQGQDVFAACGTPLVAARAGSVVYSGYHALAGNYLVVHGKGSNLDYTYMHLRQPALVKAGAALYTGQPIGEVGDTGNARGCHLHFELWTAPGWYKGGRPFDPLPDLRRWDRAS
jgi:murein DD-endopeptidase MepM/ murein hydrolase activator NlpD